MTDSIIDNILELAASHGLVARGGFVFDDVGDIPEGKHWKSMMLFGNTGSSLWGNFCSSTEYLDGEPNPLDRWSLRIGNSMARELGGKAFFPFGGPPFQPFLAWAKKSEGLESSKLGMLIHEEYGLWHAYRFAIALPHELKRHELEGLGAKKETLTDICGQCVEQPCLKKCPVDAFGEHEYKVESCYHHISTPENTCMNNGCAARRACPIGADFLYDKSHAQFHMNQFLSSMKLRFIS
ncbi:MAG: hypothetical protein GKR95_04215 [Gammaproteobacteria bacterium]|nr:hypothetical protein [Gammaproteobacteria bacterium]